VRRLGHERRAQTDQSLRVERDKTDVANAKVRKTVDGVADDVVRIARQRADQVVQTAREDADRDRPRMSTATEASFERERIRADGLVGAERSKADAVLATTEPWQVGRIDGVVRSKRVREVRPCTCLQRESTDRSACKSDAAREGFEGPSPRSRAHARPDRADSRGP